MISAVPFLLRGLSTTIVVTLGSFGIGALLGLPLMLAKRAEARLVAWIASAYIQVARGIPPIAWVLMIFFGVGRVMTIPPLLAACVALGLVSAAYLAENYRAGMEAVSTGQWEAGDSLGFTRADLFTRIIAPQGLAVALPPSTTYLVGLLKDSAVVSVIGVSDISFQALTYTQQGHPGLAAFVAAGAVYMLVGIPLAVVARRSDRFVRSKMAV